MKRDTCQFFSALAELLLQNVPACDLACQAVLSCVQVYQSHCSFTAHRLPSYNLPIDVQHPNELVNFPRAQQTLVDLPHNPVKELRVDELYQRITPKAGLKPHTGVRFRVTRTTTTTIHTHTHTHTQNTHTYTHTYNTYSEKNTKGVDFR